MVKYKVCVVLSALFLAVLIFSAGRAEEQSAERAAIFFVAPDGNDSWSGTKSFPNLDGTDGPFATPGAACAAARKVEAGRAKRIIVKEGEYFLDEPLVLTEADNGVSIQAEIDAKPVFYGGVKVTGWQRDGNKFYAAELEGVKEGKWDFRALFVNGRYCRRARLPREGTFKHLSKFDVPWMSTTGGGWKRKPTDEELTTMKYSPDDIGGWLDVNSAELTVYHMWDESLVGLSAIDTENNTVTFRSQAGHPPGAFGVDNYVVWNVREGMSEPGQWYLDRSAGKVVYWPLPGEDMTEAVVYAPKLETILRIEGVAGKPVRDIIIRGLSLTATTTPLKTGGFGAGAFDGAVHVSMASNCKLSRLEIFNVGGHGIKASGEELRIERCHVHHTGACGIRMNGYGWAISDSHVHDIGLTYPSAIGVPLGGENGRFLHNEIHDTPYSAVTCGGTNNRLYGNLIYHAMKELHDGAGIYCFAGKDLVLRDNFIRDITDTGGYGASAYYLDERSQGCIVERNLSVGVVRPSHNHMARGNTIRNNVFVNDGDIVITFPRSTEYTLERNVVVASGKIIFEGIDGISSLKNNVLFSKSGKIEGHKFDGYTSVGVVDISGSEDNSTDDPMLSEVESGAIKFAESSPAKKLGILPIDVSDVGPRQW